MSDFSIPKYRLPRFVAAIGQKLPQWPHGVALVAALNGALKMKLLPESELTALEDKLFRVQVLDTGGTAHFTYRGGLFRPVFRAGREPDLAFAAHLLAYLQLLARREDPDTLFFNRELEITGDTELGLFVKNMLDAVEWPRLTRPPLLSRRLTGDKPWSVPYY
jgi:predicted lipid carrier protein YhbT